MWARESGRRDSNPRSSAWEADAVPLSYTRMGTDLYGYSFYHSGKHCEVESAGCSASTTHAARLKRA